MRFTHTFEEIITTENLLSAWREFVVGKRKKIDVQEFQHKLMDNILQLHEELKKGVYQHGAYQGFKISDPKPRDIHKATVRDRLIHHAIYRVLYPSFDKTWAADSYSCRRLKGTHRALNRFRSFAYTVSKNHTKTCYVLKCDIRKFFASIDHQTLKKILSKFITDDGILRLLSNVVSSFNGETKVGLPLGNLTSQMLVNIYMNEFDQFAKHTLKCKYYIRYADDFVILSQNRKYLESLLPHIHEFLLSTLKLSLHPDKVFIKTFASGVDFLGWVNFPDHRVLRPASKRRMFRNLKQSKTVQQVTSYKGLLSHGNTYKLTQQL